MCVRGRESPCADVKGQLGELAFSYHPMGSKDQIQVIRLGSWRLYMISHLGESLIHQLFVCVRENVCVMDVLVCAFVCEVVPCWAHARNLGVHIMCSALSPTLFP